MDSIDTIRSIDGLWKACDQAAAKFKNRPWFRGQRDERWQLRPTVFRWLRRNKLSAERESLAYRKFQARALIRYPRPPQEDDPFGWLTLMRHFDLPTRLLDWTESVLVAAYFAVAGAQKEPGDAPRPAALWALDPSGLNGKGEAPYTPWHQDVALRVQYAFLNGSEHEPKPLAVVPCETDLRMLVQQSVFTIHGNDRDLAEFPRCEEWLIKFTIAAEFKAELHRQLTSLGITRAYLFPDLERLAHDIIPPDEYRGDDGDEEQTS